MAASLNEQEYQQLNAYLDGELSAAEQADVEQRLQSDPLWQAELDSLRVITGLLALAERVPIPRNFTLDPAVYGKPARPSVIEWLSRSLAPLGAVAAVAVVLLIMGGVILSGGAGMGADTAAESMIGDDASADMAEEAMDEEPAAEALEVQSAAPAEEMEEAAEEEYFDEGAVEEEIPAEEPAESAPADQGDGAQATSVVEMTLPAGGGEGIGSGGEGIPPNAGGGIGGDGEYPLPTPAPLESPEPSDGDETANQTGESAAEKSSQETDTAQTDSSGDDSVPRVDATPLPTIEMPEMPSARPPRRQVASALLVGLGLLMLLAAAFWGAINLANRKRSE